MLEKYLELTQTHTVYRTMLPRWRFLLQSYMGGAYYRGAELLTRYQFETDAEYLLRLETTPVDNHCRGVISVYNSFLFREAPEREYGSMALDPSLEAILEDADLEGRTFDSFMKDVSTWASVYGHVFVFVSKPQTQAYTRADELQQEIRPYVSVVAPTAVVDWRWTRAANGCYHLTYMRVIEDGEQPSQRVVYEWAPDQVRTWVIDDERKLVVQETIVPNPLGRIPVVMVYNTRSPIRDLGLGDLDDIADQQRAIYNEYSEIEQSIRISGHPSLVKTADVEAAAGAGAIVQMPPNLDPGLRPYLLEPNAQNVTAIYTSIQNRIESIDRMANLGSVRTNVTRAMSGVSREVEFQLLNARLAEKADNLELAEEQIWRLIAQYQNRAWDGEIEYPDYFGIHDRRNELEDLNRAWTMAQTDTDLQRVILHRVRDIVIDDRTAEGVREDILEHAPVLEELHTASEEQHPQTTAATREEHLQAMLMEGYSNEEMLRLHPEITEDDIVQAAAAAARSN